MSIKKRGPVGLSKVGGEFDVGYRGAKQLKKRRKKKGKKKSSREIPTESPKSLRNKLLKALKIPFKTIATKVGSGALGAASELVLPDEVGAPTLPKGYHSWSPKKKAAFANSFK